MQHLFQLLSCQIRAMHLGNEAFHLRFRINARIHVQREVRAKEHSISRNLRAEFPPELFRVEQRTRCGIVVDIIRHGLRRKQR